MFRFTRKPSSESQNYTLGSMWIRKARTRHY